MEIIIPVIAGALVIIGAIFYALYHKYILNGKRRIPKAVKLTGFEADARNLFLLIDYDMNGFLVASELHKVLTWMRDNVKDGDKWATVMYEALPLEPLESGAAGAAASSDPEAAVVEVEEMKRSITTKVAEQRYEIKGKIS